jgi:integrase
MKDRPERTRVGERVTIYPRGKKQIYVADFWFDGMHRRQSLGTANKKEALRRAMRLELDLAEGNRNSPPRPKPLAEAVAEYLAYLKTEGRARKTLVKYQGIFDIFLAFLAGHHVTRLAQFTAGWFDRYRAHRAKNRHKKTLYVEGVVIKQLFKWCRSRKLIAESPVADYRLEKPPLEPKAGPGLAEVDAILAALPEAKRSAVAVLAFTGLRAGELQRLQPGDIDLAGGWVHVVSRQGLETKTRTSRRVPIPARLRPLLERAARTDKPWLFTMPPSRKYPDGDHWLNVKRLNEDFQAAVKGLGMKAGRDTGYTLHSLRHFFETFTVNAGIPQRVVDTWLGHRSDRSMAAVYYKLRDEESQHFMEKVPFGTGAATAESVAKGS